MRDAARIGAASLSQFSALAGLPPPPLFSLLDLLECHPHRASQRKRYVLTDFTVIERKREDYSAAEI